MIRLRPTSAGQLDDAKERGSLTRSNSHASDGGVSETSTQPHTGLLRVGDPRSERLRRIEGVLDLDRFYSFLALEMMTCHFDGYARSVNNYWVYHLPGRPSPLIPLPPAAPGAKRGESDGRGGSTPNSSSTAFP